MKRYLTLGVIVAVLATMLLFRPRRSSDDGIAPDTSQPATPMTYAGADSIKQSASPDLQPEPGPPSAGSNAPGKDPRQLEMALQRANQGHDTPVAFYGLVVDQDSNALANVTVDIAITKQYMAPSLIVTTTTTRLQRETGSDGRFEVTDQKGNSVEIQALTKPGYESELDLNYGSYGPQTTSLDSPAVMKLWSTNVHEQLITGGKSFVIIPDGRHYAIDLLKGTIAEGDDGDLVAWVKRPDNIKWGQRYDWSCELSVPAGGLMESESRAMFMAPESGYSNLFDHYEPSSTNGWSDGFDRKLFYVDLRNGQMYGRIAIDLYAYYNGKTPAMIRLSYAVNPSGSRLLR